ncbi:DUF2270 domain-containing protein [Terasakiella sp. A23]|uniref:DUF2270 domain-containing protein n=1 Tax=Terasakiella sp. FCG-A23 TaxID=3080561 RepID=UPI0029531609|nr:DUF2270 domain-containing protein [Terasakiella sp. A23]MDV7341526.1 DUF2270 domain-containing protein [Terasakiella sp. A23]
MSENKEEIKDFTTAELGALAHLYRGEVYRSTTWRTRLDNTTNWAVVTTGIAFSITFSGPNASPLPLVLVGLLVIVFLVFEARRYRYFNVWRARARHIETELYAPMLLGKDYERHGDWHKILANDYIHPRHHISMIRAVGRRLRRSYAWLLSIQCIAYYGKLIIHPEPILKMSDIFTRADIGPISGEIVIFMHVLFHSTWIIVAIATLYHDKISHLNRRYKGIGMG